MHRSLFSKPLLVVSSLLLAAGCGQSEIVASNELIRTDDALGTSAPTIDFDTDGIRVSGTLTAGGTVQISYDGDRFSSCKGTLNDGRPAWSVTGYASINGAQPTSFHVAGFNPDGGASGPVSASVALPEAGELQLWFEITNRWGCQAWDSDYGRNFKFEIAAAPERANAPDWMGNVRVLISRAGGGCDAAVPLPNDAFTFGTWARSRAAETMLCFEAWEPGVTDFDNADLWKQLDARIYYRYGDTGPFQFSYVDFDGRVGNNARYRAELRGMDPFHIYQQGCPDAPLTFSEDGYYVNTTLEFYFEINGKQLRPAGGGQFLGHFDDYSDKYKTCP